MLTSHVEAAAPRPCKAAAPEDLADWFPKLPKARRTTKFSRTRARQLLYQDRRCEEALIQRAVRRCRSRAARLRRPLMPPVYIARTHCPLASPSRAARSRRPLAQSPRPARLRRPLAPPARARNAVLLIRHGPATTGVCTPIAATRALMRTRMPNSVYLLICARRASCLASCDAGGCTTETEKVGGSTPRPRTPRGNTGGRRGGGRE